MTGILNKFHVEHGIHGARVMARPDQLTPNCASDDEIDTCIQMLARRPTWTVPWWR